MDVMEQAWEYLNVFMLTLLAVAVIIGAINGAILGVITFQKRPPRNQDPQSSGEQPILDSDPERDVV